MEPRSCFVRVTPPRKVLVRVPTKLTSTKPSPAVGLPMTRIGSLNWEPVRTMPSPISDAETLTPAPRFSSVAGCGPVYRRESNDQRQLRLRTPCEAVVPTDFGTSITPPKERQQAVF